MTAAARSFCPRVAGSLEKRRPAPLGSAPAGRSRARAALATDAASRPPAAFAAARVSWKSAQAAENPARASSFASAVGESGHEIVYFDSPSAAVPDLSLIHISEPT